MEQQITPLKSQISKLNRQKREELAFAYQVFAQLNMDDLTYAHLSLRSAKGDSYFIHPFGLLFSEVTPGNLLEVDCEGQIRSGKEQTYNLTGYIIHGSIYKARPDIQAIFHLHTTAGVAVSSMKCGLLPISQFSFHFYNRIAYHQYQSLALDPAFHGRKLVEDLSQHNAMFLENHGTLVVGQSIQEAFFRAYYLEEACKVQVAVANHELITPSPDICEQAALDMRAYEKELGRRDWEALKRKYSHLLVSSHDEG